MSISSLSGPGQSAQAQDLPPAAAKVQSAIANLVENTQQGQPVDDTAALSPGSQAQAQVSALKQASGNLAQVSSLVQVADGGLATAQGIVGQLQSLASEAGGASLTSSDRKALNQQFQGLAQNLNDVAGSTTFDGQGLLDGSVSGTNSLSLDNALSVSGNSAAGSNDTPLSFPSVDSDSLFGGAPLNILSLDAAAQAFAVSGTALDTLNTARSNVSNFQQSLEVAGATVDSAVANRDAAGATLSEADLSAGATPLSQNSLQQNPTLSIAAQGNLLSPSLLQLVG